MLGHGFTGGCEVAIGKMGIGGGVTIGAGNSSKNAMSPYISFSKPLNYTPKGLSKYNAKCIQKFGNFKLRFKLSPHVGYTVKIDKESLSNIWNKTKDVVFYKYGIRFVKKQKKYRNYIEYRFLSKTARVYKSGKIIVKY